MTMTMNMAMIHSTDLFISPIPPKHKHDWNFFAGQQERGIGLVNRAALVDSRSAGSYAVFRVLFCLRWTRNVAFRGRARRLRQRL